MKEKLQADMKEAMKAKDQMVVLTLRGLIAEIKKQEIDTKTTLNEEQVLAIIQKEIKKRRDTLKFAQEGGRQDLVDQTNREMSILSKYLGEQISEDKLREIIIGLVKSGADNVGKIMGALNKDHKGKFDGRLASELAKQALG